MASAVAASAVAVVNAVAGSLPEGGHYARDSEESKVGDSSSSTSTPTFVRGNGIGGRREGGKEGEGKCKVHIYQGHQSVAHNLNLNKYIIQNSHSPNPYSQAIVEAHVTVACARALTVIDTDAQGVLPKDHVHQRLPQYKYQLPLASQRDQVPSTITTQSTTTRGDDNLINDDDDNSAFLRNPSLADLSSDEEDLTSIAQRLWIPDTEISTGAALNFKKTEVLASHPPQAKDKTSSVWPVQTVTKYKYLGVLIDHDKAQKRALDIIPKVLSLQQKIVVTNMNTIPMPF
ncbi:hypothetical protein Pelo_18739 [Pelomyxa schiedti]|nr:hypothetical protein Pelo_18739 [Pelomyxa schiedti]